MIKKIIAILSACIFCGLGAAAAAPSAELYINSDTVDNFAQTSIIEGCAVTYDFTGECDLYTAFYKGGILIGADKHTISTAEGNNYFMAEIENAEKYADCEIKYFLWNEMTPLDTEADFYRLNDFSDSLEPYYPMLTAAQKTTEDIYNATLPADFELTQAQAQTRYNVVEMYKNAGFDIVHSMQSSEYNKFSIPSSWSKLTPKSLTGEYEQTYSIDACFNRKIPDKAPRVELNDEVLDLSGFQLAVVNSKNNQGGQGTGIARVIGTEDDPVMSVASRWDASVYYVQTLYNMHLPEDTADRLNYNMSSDRHAVFIDDTLKAAVHMYKVTPPSLEFEYDIHDGRLPGYDIRGRASGAMSDLTGIGADGLSGAYASKVPSDGMTIKSNEIKNSDTMINHAISAAINPVMYGVVYPAITSDCGGVNDASNFGAVPEGGLIQLDKDIDLDSLYNSGKLSLPGYKILKAMQEYGMYNVDRTGSSKGYGVMMYTSTNSNDWINESDSSFNVPYKNNAQGYSSVNSELEAFFSGDEFFGIEKPKLYATIPVVKYAKLDLNSDGTVNEADKALVTTENHDINCDGKVNDDDVRVYDNYFTDTAQQLDDVYTISIQNNDNLSGKLIINGAVTGAYPEYKVRKGTTVTVSAVGWTGYEFSHWTGDAQGEEADTLVLRADKDYTLGAKYTAKPVYALSINKNEGGQVLVSTNGKDYGEAKAQYPKGTLLYLKAVSDEGYMLESWSGDASGVADIQKAVITDCDLNINVNFVKGYNESYLSENWETVNKKLPEGAYTVNPSSKRISFNYSSFNYKPILINNAVGLVGDWSVSVGIRESIPMGSGHPALIIFGYIDEKNYQYLEFDEDGNGSATLYKVVDGAASKTAQCSKELISDGFNSCPVDIKIQCKDGKLSVKGYKNGKEITYFENLEGSFSGRFGVGAAFHGYLYFNNIKATYTGDAQTHAEYDAENNYVNIYGYSVGAENKNSVSLMCVNNTDNSIYYTRQYTPENDGYYRFTFKVFDDISNYSIILRSGSEGVKPIEFN